MSKTTVFVIKPGQQDKGRQDACEFLINNINHTMTVKITDGKPVKRSMSANELQAVWIRTIAEEKGDSEFSIRLWIKTNLALPVLRYNVETQEEIDMAARVNYTLKKIGFDLMVHDESQQFRVMELIAVTSVMTRRQHKVFMDQVHRHYAQEGIVLGSKNDRETQAA